MHRSAGTKQARRGAPLHILWADNKTPASSSVAHLALEASVSKLSRSSMVRELERYGTRRLLLLLRIIWLRTRTQSCNMSH